MKKTVKGFLSLLLIAVLLSGMLTAAAADADTPADPVDPPEMSDPVTTDPAEPDPSNESDDAQPSENPDNPDPAEDPNPAEDPGEPDPSESPEIPADVTVTFCDTDGKTVIKTLVLKAGDVLNAAEIPVVTGDGLRIGGWKEADISAPVLEDTVFTAACAFALDSVNHMSYISGYKDYTFRPENYISRAEAAQMLSRLLILRGTGTKQTSFSDVAQNAWYASPVAKLASINVIRGYKNGTFAPNGNITRAEFVVMLSRMYSLTGAKVSFSDIKAGAWYYNAVTAAAANGWISGYKDGTFRPDNPISRAEAVTILNRVLGRKADSALVKNVLPVRQSFLDVPSKAWYASAVLEAAVKHSYTRDSDGEHWGSYHAPHTLAAGCYNFSGRFAAVDENGLFIMQEPGVASYNGKTYHVSARGVLMDYVWPEPTQFSDGMYCGDGTGAVLTNADWGHLHFYADGKYSSGNAELDGLMATFLAQSTNASAPKEERLRQVYLYMRDSGRFGYLGLPHYGRGTTDWAIPSAITFLKLNKGNCYCWAGTFCYAARALGFDAYVVSGGVPSGNVDHAWTMIHWSDGVDYLFDIELEWGHMHGYYSNQYYKNRYKLAPGHYPNAYYFP